MKKLKLFPKTFLYTFSLMIIIVAVSHLLVYILLPTVYNYRQRNALEADIEKLCEEIADTEDTGRLALVTDFAGKWYADILVKYDGYTYEMKLLNVGDDGYLKCSEDTENPSGDKEDVSIIAEESDGKIKISLSRNPKGDKNFLYAEQIFPNQKGYVRAVISRQQIEDAVSTIIVILPVTAFALRRGPLNVPPTNPPTSFSASCLGFFIAKYSRRVSGLRAGVSSRLYSSDSHIIRGCQLTDFRLSPAEIVIFLLYCKETPRFHKDKNISDNSNHKCSIIRLDEAQEVATVAAND